MYFELRTLKINYALKKIGKIVLVEDFYFIVCYIQIEINNFVSNIQI